MADSHSTQNIFFGHELDEDGRVLSRCKHRHPNPSRQRKHHYEGTRVGRLNVVEYLGCLILSGTKHLACYYRCVCECGKEAIVRSGSLDGGPKGASSCGCWSTERKKQNRIKLEGRRYGRLTVLEHAWNHPTIDGRPIYRCKCDCGNESLIDGQALRQRMTTSCGCLKLDMFAEQATIHGKSQSPEYKAWQHMKNRCKNSLFYIEKGIKVCERWAGSFEDFIADVGVKPTLGHTLDRIDNSKGYEPGNVRWATAKEQGNNKTNNRMLTCRGKTKRIGQWAKEMGLSTATIYSRLRKGMSEEQAVLTPNRLKISSGL